MCYTDGTLLTEKHSWLTYGPKLILAEFTFNRPVAGLA